MEQEVYVLKRALKEFEKNIHCSDRSRAIENVDEMIFILKRLKRNLLNSFIKEKTNFIKIDCKIINRIDFMYKPVKKKNYYEGDYLLEFSKERTNELKEAGILDIHNKFWTEHKTIKGNVFGSVPKELISKKAEKSLIRNGWIEVSVNILDIKSRNVDVKEIIEFCDLNFKHYILIKEEATSTFLILEYEI
ncbi:hypothetical protein [Caminicella sporogenes]|uniref:hypothetical protein n=1 Tax=Caminicella sporogenes TaxID=166485 RepID=UPI002541EE09|nr:hypothetical protein [Caminicella sporogenes]WIF94862.1 hypothetical protein QNI18_11460 [Caminicella sporogenes]